ncbi:hypothetical protein H1Q58_16285 (plasmid) [Planococcus maritimus]|uniref:Lipoprotein n=1 Tax=Planococcus maritimus TaxID=192421 RepID=A0A7D7RYU8_PLAMR|nr:hypothetical protein [Planococcus maritimus]QMT19142.1 hypothetical protein H1Q58_16285 [Planococcus maritimus]
MKKWLLIGFLLFVGVIIVGCTSDEEKQEVSKENTKVFTQEDFEKAEEMTRFLDETMNDFEKEANQLIEDGTIDTGNNDNFSEAIKNLAQETVIVPFLERYPDSLIAGDASTIPLTFEPTTTEPCGFGNCAYDKVEVLDVEYNFETRDVYTSEEFKYSQLIYSDVQMKYEEQSEEEKQSAVLSFVKTTDGNLIFSQVPSLHVENLDLKKADEEYAEIQSSVPESEVEAEQEAYRSDVEETLAHYPELQ